MGLSVFLGILTVEAVIFVPAYYGRQNALLNQLRNHARTVVSTLQVTGIAEPSAEVLQTLVDRDGLIVSLALIGPDGAIRAAAVRDGQIGTTFDREALVGYGDSDRVLDMRIASNPPSDIDYSIQLDRSHVETKLRDFAWRMGGLVLLISVTVAALAFFIVSLIIIRPMLALRDSLIRAQTSPGDADLSRKDGFATSEMTDMAEALNALLSELARSHGDAISHREQKFSDFAEASSDWFWEMDEELRFSYFSERFTQVTGVPQEALLGKTRQETGIPNVDPTAWQEHLDNLAARRPFRNFIHPRTMDDGETVWVSINGKPIYDAENTFLGYRGTGADITALVRAEEAIRHAGEEAQRANQAKSDFLAAMSHELRTPLNAIIGFSEATREQIAGPVGNPQYLEYAGYIHSSGEHLLHLVNQILDLSKIEAGKTDLDEESFRLDESIEEAVRMVSANAEAKSIAIEQRLPAVPVYLLADASKIRQILINLLSNAVKFTPEDGRIVVRAELDDGGAGCLSVEDSGPGIAAEDIEIALSPFGQIRMQGGEHHAGTGLGLPLCKGYTELHGGSLTIDSQAGHGTRVNVRLPASRILPADGPADTLRSA